ncbi:DNA/RNA non-specific endonuclease [Alistipes putredinis]|uniref:DNA/RNA non-specific endonuclease n=1 Tax=Alistipes putredinis TaxID=28117 RepID=UPI003AB4D592
MKKYFLCMVALLSLAIVACESDDTAPAPAVRPTFDLIDAQPDVTSAVVAANIESKGEAPISEVGFSYQEAGGEYVDVVCTNFKDGLARQTLTGLKPDTEYRWYCYAVLGGERFNASLSKTFKTLKEGEVPPAPTPQFGKPSASEVQAASTASPLTYELNGLEPETKYDFYAYVVIGDERYTSAVAQFTTLKAGENPDPEFGPVAATDVTASSATLTGSFTYEGEETVGIEVGFAYKASGETDYATKTVTASSGDKSAAITGLSAATTYTFHLYASIGGKQYRSQEGTFTTESGTVPPPENVYRTGWAELPVEVQNSDYYYAYHICPDFSVNGHRARNISICYSAEHHCPVWVSGPVHSCYKGSNGNRNYGPDPVIPSSIQPKNKTVEGSYNKGHMIGNNERSRTSGMNKQVSYYTNMAPQHSSTFNTGGGAWNNLEDKIDSYWCADTLYTVVGCYFETWTDSYGNTAQPKRTGFGGVQASVPTMFYTLLLRTKKGNTEKSVMECSREELQCVAFVMSHAMQKEHEPERRDMRSVAEIERLTGFTFFANVPNAPKDTYNPSDWGL